MKAGRQAGWQVCRDAGRQTVGRQVGRQAGEADGRQDDKHAHRGEAGSMGRQGGWGGRQEFDSVTSRQAGGQGWS